MRKDNNKWRRLAQYFAGECPKEEHRRLEAWIQADPERLALANKLRRVWEASEQMPGGSPPDGRLDVEADFEELIQKIHARKIHARKERAPASDRPPAFSRRSASDRQPASRPTRGRSASSFGRPSSSFRQFASVAVLLILFVGGGLLALTLSGGFPLGESPVREVVTGPGERATLRLADGTEVTLNVDSRLRLSETFSQGRSRAVYLQGEAYFDVAPNAQRPFIVHAGEAVVRVKGTAFNVEAYPEGREVEVAVAEGTVVLVSKEKEQAPAVRLKRGQLGRLEAGSARVTKEQAEVEAYLAWIQGRLVFENTPLPEVAIQLERWYDIECKIRGDVPRSLHLTAVLNSRSIRDVLDVISASLGLQYRIEGNTVFLMERSNSCRRHVDGLSC